jgi:hypothetical protein
MKLYKMPKITIHGSLVDITKTPNEPAGKSDAFGSGIINNLPPV